jgi:hypothetical protein
VICVFGRNIDRQKFCKYGWDNLFQKSSIVKECGDENLVVSSDRNKIAIEFIIILKEQRNKCDAGTRIKWPRIRVIPPSLIASYISFTHLTLKIINKSLLN